MGYGITTTAFYGFHLDTTQSEKLVSCLGDFIKAHPTHPLSVACNNTGTNPGDNDFDWYAMYKYLSEAVGQKVEMIAEDSDSRIHDCTYEPGFEHGLGVVLGASGYGGKESSKELTAIIRRGPTDEQDQAYIKSIEKWVQFAGITEEPCVVVVSNTD